MKKKLASHIMDIATNNRFCYQYTRDMRYFVTDSYRILEYDRPIDNLEINAHDNGMIDMMDKFIRLLNDYYHDYHLYELPKIDEIRQGIRDMVGRKLTPVVWSDGIITINARYLLKAMESLNATVCYISTPEPHKQCIALFENDDLTGMVRELILPIYNPEHRVGFWIKETR